MSGGASLSGGGSPRPRPRPSRLSRLPGGTPALVAFGLSLVSYTLQTEAAQHVQQSLGYRKPFLSLYLGHSGFVLLFPIHLLFLKWYTGKPISHFLHLMSMNLHWQLSTPTKRLEGEIQDSIRKRLSSYGGRASGELQHSRSSSLHNHDNEADAEAPAGVSASWRDSIATSLSISSPQYNGYFERTWGFSVPKLILLLLVLMIGITIPALSWYCAVPMTSMADITALYNTFSVWALVFSVWFLGEKWNRYKVLSVAMACGGVVVVAYGGSEHRRVVGGGSSSSSSIGSSAMPTMASTTSTDSILPSTSATSSTLAAAATVTKAAVQALVLPRRADDEPPSPPPSSDSSTSAANPLLGDLLALFGAVTMAAYEMAFKLLGTLPDEEEQTRRWQRSASSTEGQRLSRRSVRIGDDQDDDDEEGGEGSGLLNHDEQHVLGQDEDDEEEEDEEQENNRGDAAAAAPASAKRHSQMTRTLSSSERTAIWTPPTDGDGDPSPAYGYGSRDGGPSPARRASDAPDLFDADSLSRKMSDVAKKPNCEDDRVGHDRDGEDDDEEEEEAMTSNGKRKNIDVLSSSSSVSSADSNEAQREPTPRPRRLRPKSQHSILAPQSWVPPPLPFGLHANAITAGIGLVTFLTLWIGIVIAHYTNLERFEWPKNWTTVGFILFVIFAGIIFNGCFMVLLAIWGPVTASVSCLLSTVAVAVLDAVIRAHWSVVSFVGCAFIIAGFGVLLLDGGGH